MAALILVAGAALVEKLEKQAALKKAKKDHDDARYKELVEETERRLSLSRTESDGQVIRHESGEEFGASAEDEAGPSRHEDVVGGETDGRRDSGLVNGRRESMSSPKRKKGLRALWKRE